MKYAESVIDLIGNTPLIKLSRIAPGYEIFGKCEFMNPLSIKDRPVLQIIDDAEKSGQLKPGGTLVECTSGNTGMAVAYISVIKGYRAVLVMSEIQSVERRKILKALGAELILTPASEGTEGARIKMKKLCEEKPNWFYVGQHINPSNPKAHYNKTGPEIWEDTDGKIHIFDAGLGTGGTISGAGRYLKEKNPNVRLIAIEPKESPYISKGIFRTHRMMGTAPGFVPKTLDKEIIDEIFLVSEDEAFTMCREIALKEGLLVGITSGATVFASIQLLKREENKDKLIVCILADTGQRYLSVEGLFSSEKNK